ncbi:unnamed protein product [Adineta ricciae]|uniref:Uncharacterized protein n=1 Tax=Adineta ricciae TaxID=249248 RepID=A0A814DG46_ADIRI|nr:unnamed protein product [Adineta ricciae]
MRSHFETSRANSRIDEWAAQLYGLRIREENISSIAVRLVLYYRLISQFGIQQLFVGADTIVVYGDYI